MHSKAPHISAIGGCFLFESILRIATRQSYYVDALVREARMSKITFDTAVAQLAEATRRLQSGSLQMATTVLAYKSINPEAALYLSL